MTWIERNAEFYRGFLAKDRSAAPVAAVLLTQVAACLLLYLVGLVDPAPGGAALAAASGAGWNARAVGSASRPTAGR